MVLHSYECLNLTLIPFRLVLWLDFFFVKKRKTYQICSIKMTHLNVIDVGFSSKKSCNDLKLFNPEFKIVQCGWCSFIILNFFIFHVWCTPWIRYHGICRNFYLNRNNVFECNGWNFSLNNNETQTGEFSVCHMKSTQIIYNPHTRQNLLKSDLYGSSNNVCLFSVYMSHVLPKTIKTLPRSISHILITNISTSIAFIYSTSCSRVHQTILSKQKANSLRL